MNSKNKILSALEKIRRRIAKPSWIISNLKHSGIKPKILFANIKEVKKLKGDIIIGMVRYPTKNKRKRAKLSRVKELRFFTRPPYMFYGKNKFLNNFCIQLKNKGWITCDELDEFLLSELNLCKRLYDKLYQLCRGDFIKNGWILLLKNNRVKLKQIKKKE